MWPRACSGPAESSPGHLAAQLLLKASAPTFGGGKLPPPPSSATMHRWRYSFSSSSNSSRLSSAFSFPVFFADDDHVDASYPTFPFARTATSGSYDPYLEDDDYYATITAGDELSGKRKLPPPPGLRKYFFMDGQRTSFGSSPRCFESAMSWRSPSPGARSPARSRVRSPFRRWGRRWSWPVCRDKDVDPFAAAIFEVTRDRSSRERTHKGWRSVSPFGRRERNDASPPLPWRRWRDSLQLREAPPPVAGGCNLVASPFHRWGRGCRCPGSERERSRKGWRSVSPPPWRRWRDLLKLREAPPPVAGGCNPIVSPAPPQQWALLRKLEKKKTTLRPHMDSLFNVLRLKRNDKNG